ncbi:MAG: SusC/RagA family TonB-linked outer membrane protein [Muribaculaceae bacterium]|nr:SusC/RagA family TonB-linked outer membrane protein [Muribaculaceae bacterium]
MKRLLSILMAICLISMSAWANKTVTGKVVSASDNEPLIGATVQAIGSSQGTSTDLDGQFTVTVNDNVTQLRVSCVGYKSKVVAVTSYVTVALEDANTALDEVVVTAMGIKREAKALGVSATPIKGDVIAQARTNDIMSSLAGKVAGVQIAETSSDPGTSKSVIIRGVSSLSGSNQPLYVVDGVPLNNSATYSSDGLNSGYDFGNGASAVNPNDVESMTILKGAAATALYGSRAGAGVILITTKKGTKQNRGVGIEYNGGLQWESVMRLPQMQNSFGMGWYGDHTEIENGSWGPAFDGSQQLYGWVYNNSQNMKSYLPVKNNVKDFFSTGFRYSNSISFNGATDKSNYFVSLSQINDDGIIPEDADTYTKYTVSARGSHTAGAFTFSTSLNYAFQRNHFVTTGQKTGSMYNSIMQTPRDISIVEMKDLDNPFNTPGYYYTPYGVTNPYYIINNYQNEYEQERFYGNLQLDYNFLKYFTATYRFGLDTNTGHHNYGSPNMAALFKDTPNYEDALKDLTGEVSQSITRRREIDQNFMLTYDQQILDDWHVNAQLGFNGNERTYKYLGSTVTNLTIPMWYNLSNSAEIPSTSQSEWKRRYLAVFGSAEFAWKNMVYLTLQGRNDWSSTLPVNNRSYFYPGVSLSFLFSELLKPEQRDIINFGKFRIAWGRTGNDAGVYMTNSVFAQAAAATSGFGNGSSFPFNKVGVNAYSMGNVLGSQNLSPEMTSEFEVGLNMAFWRNRFSFDAAYYDRNTDKQIFSLNMDPATGYTAQNMNLGKIRNRGVEFLVSITPVKIGDFQWDINWNFTKNWSKVIKLPEELGGIATIYGLSGGTSLYAIEGEPLGVFKAYVPQMTEDGKIICDGEGQPLVNPEQQIVGSMNYKYMMGFGTTLSYKGVSLTANLDIRHGGLLYSRTKDITYFTGNAIQTAYNNRNPFIVPNSVQQIGTDDKDNPVYGENTTPLDETGIFTYWDAGGADLDRAFLVDKSYVKLRSVVLGWQLPSRWFAKTFITGINLSVFGNNLFLWTPKSNTFIDPETSTFGNDLEGNYGEFSANPSSRKFGFNVQVKF